MAADIEGNGRRFSALPLYWDTPWNWRSGMDREVYRTYLTATNEEMLGYRYQFFIGYLWRIRQALPSHTRLHVTKHLKNTTPKCMGCGLQFPANQLES